MSCALKKCALRIIHYSMAPSGPFLPFPIPRLISGEGSVGKLPNIIASAGVGNVLLVTDPGIISAGLVAPLEENLTEKGIRYTLFSDVQPNPTIANVESGLKVFLDNGCKGFVSIGGGERST